MRYIISDDEERDIIALVQGFRADLDDADIRSFLNAEWDEPEHGDWLRSATRADIADWILAGLANTR